MLVQILTSNIVRASFDGEEAKVEDTRALFQKFGAGEEDASIWLYLKDGSEIILAFVNGEFLITLIEPEGKEGP